MGEQGCRRQVAPAAAVLEIVPPAARDNLTVVKGRLTVRTTPREQRTESNIAGEHGERLRGAQPVIVCCSRKTVLSMAFPKTHPICMLSLLSCWRRSVRYRRCIVSKTAIDYFSNLQTAVHRQPIAKSLVWSPTRGIGRVQASLDRTYACKSPRQSVAGQRKGPRLASSSRRTCSSSPGRSTVPPGGC